MNRKAVDPPESFRKLNLTVNAFISCLKDFGKLFAQKQLNDSTVSQELITVCEVN